jgi:sugar/nucleoside kinase (ribokinase family)
MTDHVFIAGPASWNQIVELERLPEPVPHMQFALGAWETVGGTSAGKALALAGLGRRVTLHTLLGDDADGERVRGLLTAVGVELLAGDAFMAGVLDATLAGADVPEALRAGSRHAASVLVTRHLHPSLDALLGV